ncbi:MAG: hypothetical protein U0N43_04225 [Mediterraneibacter sp.]
MERSLNYSGCEQAGMRADEGKMQKRKTDAVRAGGVMTWRG